VQLLSNVKNIFILNEGRIVEIGSYDEINEILEKSIMLNSIAKSKKNESTMILSPVREGEAEISEDHSSFIEQPYSDSSVESESESVSKQNESSSTISLSLISLAGIGKQLSRLEEIVRGVSNRFNMSAALPSQAVRVSVNSPTIIRRATQSVMERYGETKTSKEQVDSFVQLKDWRKMFSYGIGNLWFLFGVLICFLFNGIHVYVYIILAEWVIDSKADQQDSDTIYIYAGLIILSAILLFFAYLINSRVFWTSSKKMHEQMVWKLLRAPMSYHDSNSIGKVLTRFTKDIQ